MALPISEIFYSIQGEGPKAGEPRVFIRTFGCNLRCKWGDSLCDTPYTSWSPEGDELDVAEVAAAAAEYKYKCSKIVLTGGEPTMARDLPMLAGELRRGGFGLEIETNGTGPVPDEIDLIVCSPKLSDSSPVDTAHFERHERERRRIRDELRGDPRLFLKFVAAPSSDISEILNLVEFFDIPGDRVYLMPEGRTAETVRAASAAVWALALRHGFNFSSRLHVIAFDDKRGI